MKHPRFVVNLTVDGCAGIIGFGETGKYVSFNDGKGSSGPVKTLTSDISSSRGKLALETWFTNLNTRIYCRAVTSRFLGATTYVIAYR